MTEQQQENEYWRKRLRDLEKGKEKDEDRDHN
jgi:hypothetical protein